MRAKYFFFCGVLSIPFRETLIYNQDINALSILKIKPRRSICKFLEVRRNILATLQNRRKLNISLNKILAGSDYSGLTRSFFELVKSTERCQHKERETAFSHSPR